mmetsp:Transcript_17149/g.39707  ORF Transcript_17149/g.39707 Transcript_17149/m.39707 type:complete len:150 (-) Transcript_17149:245-694(-)
MGRLLGSRTFGILPRNQVTELDTYSYTNLLGALVHAPGQALLHIVLFMSFLEFRRIRIIQEEGANYMPGDLRIGQGEGRWNPLGFKYTPEQYEEKRLQELNHCRVAMVAVFGLWCQCLASGVDVATQLGSSFQFPDYYDKAGYFIPQGI